MFKQKETIGIATITKNRIKNLIPSLLTWLELDQVSVINIFDFRSDIPVYGALRRYSILDDKRINVYRCEKEEDFHRTKFWNIAISETNADKILKLDSDYKIHPQFINYHPLTGKKLFYAGNWKTARVKNESFLHGLVYARKEDFLGVGGYNERLTGYGWEDDDIYQRMKDNGCEYLDISYDYAYHIPHSHLERIKADRRRNPEAYNEEWATVRDIEGALPLYKEEVESEMMRLVWENKRKAEENPWGTWDEMTTIKSKKQKDNLTIFEY
tara:strand:+ start:17618 stop:18427 length:810 start_codon:yes stop_codon:yes gene_type:complete